MSLTFTIVENFVRRAPGGNEMVHRVAPFCFSKVRLPGKWRATQMNVGVEPGHLSKKRGGL